MERSIPLSREAAVSGLRYQDFKHEPAVNNNVRENLANTARYGLIARSLAARYRRTADHFLIFRQNSLVAMKVVNKSGC